MGSTYDGEEIRDPAPEGERRSALRATVLLAAAFLVAVPGAYLAWSRAHRTWTAEGTLWIEQGATREGGSTVFPGDAEPWIALLRSHEVLDGVPGAAPDELGRRLAIRTGRRGALHVALAADDPQEAERLVNAVMDRTVEVALKLKTSRLAEVRKVLEEQDAMAQAELADAEQALEAFGERTVDAPSGRTVPPAAVKATEARLKRRVAVAEVLLDELRRRVEAARTAAATATSDLRVLSRASVR